MDKVDKVDSIDNICAGCSAEFVLCEKCKGTFCTACLDDDGVCDECADGGKED